MVNTIYATKSKLTQTWDKQGHRHPITVLDLSPHLITQIKTPKKDGYAAIQIGFGQTKPKRLNQAQVAHLKKTKSDITPRSFFEIKIQESDLENYQLGQLIDPTSVLSIGDQIKVTGTSKGRGFTGVMKRWGFSGGPRSHGQSDRERAPGSIGQGTTPGRVYKGKKMAGRHGNQQHSISNLTVAHIDTAANQVWITGTVPGAKGQIIKLIKTGTSKFPGLLLEEKSPESDSPDTSTNPKSQPDAQNTNPSSDSPNQSQSETKLTESVAQDKSTKDTPTSNKHLDASN